MKQFLSLRIIFALSFCVLLGIMNGCKKDKKTTSGCKHSPLVLLDSTCNLGGTKTWHGTFLVWHYPVLDTTYTIDSTFSITVLNNSTIVVWGDTLVYNTDSAVAGSLYYHNLTGLYTIYLQYRYVNDSIYFHHNYQQSITREFYSFHTP
jgi:hypothetical protein